MKKAILDLEFEKLEEICLANNEKKYRAKQIFKWIYGKRVLSFFDMSDISKQSQKWFDENFVIDLLRLELVQTSKDGTRKFLFKTLDEHFIETVLMKHDYGYSICVTTQLGCNMGCKFCASGLLKKKRNLSAGEIVDQVLMVSRMLDLEGERISNIVVMGIGEPLDNFDNLKSFLKIVNHDLGLGIGARHITVSTCGLAPMIKKFVNEFNQINLAISLHAPTDELRDKIMPINKIYNIEVLFESLRYYSSHSNRRLTFEYILIKNLNDTVDCAIKLADLIRGLNAYVNLIPYNPVMENDFETSSLSVQMKFFDTLMKSGVQATLRKEHGSDIDAACGQLRAKRERVEK